MTNIIDDVRYRKIKDLTYLFLIDNDFYIVDNTFYSTVYKREKDKEGNKKYKYRAEIKYSEAIFSLPEDKIIQENIDSICLVIRNEQLTNR